MYKEDLIRLAAGRSRQTIAVSREVINNAIDIIMEQMQSGGSVTLSGFGTFELQQRSQRIGRNPHTGAPVDIPARVIPHFKPAKTFKDSFAHIPACQDSFDPPFVK